MRHEKHSGYGRTADLDDLVPALQDTPEFKAHAALFSKAVCSFKKPSYLSAIRKRMGKAFRERWVELTTVYLSDEIENVGAVRDCWRKRTKPKMVLPDVSNRTLFTSDGSDAKVFPIL